MNFVNCFCERRESWAEDSVVAEKGVPPWYICRPRIRAYREVGGVKTGGEAGGANVSSIYGQLSHGGLLAVLLVHSI